MARIWRENEAEHAFFPPSCIPELSNSPLLIWRMRFSANFCHLNTLEFVFCLFSVELHFQRLFLRFSHFSRSKDTQVEGKHVFK